MFGRYEGDISYSDTNVTIQLERSAEIPRYVRSCLGNTIEKIIPSARGTVIINPVEPVNLPLPLSSHLEISFPQIVLSPGISQKVFLKFPLEIGVFFESGGDMHVLDLFSLVPAKYSLYGAPDAGMITRWHQSDIYLKKPVADRYREGVLELAIRNNSSETMEVSRAVFDSDSLHLFYGDIVEMAADMEVYSPVIARTTVRDLLPQSCSERCIEIYTARRIPVVQGKGFLMEHGVA